MRHQYNLKHIEDIASEKWVSLLLPNLEQNICLGAGATKFFLKDSWYCLILERYTFYHSLGIFSLLKHHVLCKTTIKRPQTRLAPDFFETNDVHWWKTPPGSPDLNPIENLWHELKEHLLKPQYGIKSFGATATEEKCRKYIGHHRKVIPKVIEVEGAS